MLMQLFVLVFLAMIGSVVAAVAFLLSMVVERGRGASLWRHLIRAAGAASGVVVGVMADLTATVIAANIGMVYNKGQAALFWAAMIVIPLVVAGLGGVLALPLVRLAYVTIRWLAREIGVAGTA